MVKQALIEFHTRNWSSISEIVYTTVGKQWLYSICIVVMGAKLFFQFNLNYFQLKNVVLLLVINIF